MEHMRFYLKKVPIARAFVSAWRSVNDKHGMFKKLRLLSVFFSDYRAYARLPRNEAFTFSLIDLYPRIYDKISSTPVDPIYFYQDTWCAKKIFDARPKRHVDVGSSAEFIGIISQAVPTSMVDIRPLPVSLPSLSFMEGSVLNLPFKDNEITSLSSICVIEHIGLGRYGDDLDPFGSEKAAAELTRVLAPGGNLYVSVPVDTKNKVCFNAHRTFTPDSVRSLFSPLTLVEERYIYGTALVEDYDPTQGFGTGLYHFRKSLAKVSR